MTNAKKGRFRLASSMIAIIVCLCMLMGATYAWFTDTDTSSGNIIKSGVLDVKAYWADATEEPQTLTWKEFSDGAIFNYDNWEPGYVSAKHVKIANEGSLAFKYKCVIEPNGYVSKLANVIDVYYLDQATQLTEASMIAEEYKVGTLAQMIADVDGAGYGVLLPYDVDAKNDYEVVGEKTVTIALKMQEDAGFEYGGLSIGTDFDLKLYATQYAYEEDDFGKDYDNNATYPEVADTWDGTTDFSWYKSDEKVQVIDSAEAFSGFITLSNGLSPDEAAVASIDGWDGQPISFEGKTVKLDADIDLEAYDENGNRVSIAPIGDVKQGGTPFKGTFDGNGHTIENLYQSGWAFGYEWGSYGSIGLFSEIESATIKNVNISGTYSIVEGGDVSFIAGSATGECVFENITISDASIGTYNNGCGGIIGWSGAGSYTFKNITLAEDVVLGGLWGSFDSSIGGIVGQGEPGATYNFENVNIACRLDVYNDCTASYDHYKYRMSGMIIGRLEETTTIDGVKYPDTSKYNITCKDVTVTYGDWANYHYCDPTPGFNGGRGMRVEAGFEYEGLPADYDHSTCTTHHNELIPFDQIFGGDQLGVKGLEAYDGVTVVYNNK